MSRYIDFHLIGELVDFHGNVHYEDLKNLPTADVVEVVRCKDCKYCEHWYSDKGRCFLWHESGIDVFEDGFCNYAERREDARDIISFQKG